jgi:hypothetical protein
MAGLVDIHHNAAGPHINVVCDDGTNQADIACTTYNVNGGGIFHGRHARGTEASPSATQKGDIIAGIGGRAYHSGGAFHVSSPTSIHWVAAENQTESGYGSYLRILTTPVGSTTRQERVIVAPDGTLWQHDTATFDPTDTDQTSPVADVGILASAGSGNVSIGVAGYGGRTMGLRGFGANGTPASPTASNSGDWLCYMGGHGYGTTGWSSGARALVGFKASEAWSDAAQGAYVIVEATPAGSTTRQEVARFGADNGLEVSGQITADSDSSADPDLRLSNYYNDAHAATLLLRKARGTEASPSAVQQYDVLGNLQAHGYVNGAMRQLFSFQFVTIAAPSTNYCQTIARLYANDGNTGNVQVCDFRDDGIDLASGNVLKVGGTQVVTSQQSHIADPSGGLIVDSEARTAINSILSTLETHGLVASS